MAWTSRLATLDSFLIVRSCLEVPLACHCINMSKHCYALSFLEFLKDTFCITPLHLELPLLQCSSTAKPEARLIKSVDFARSAYIQAKVCHICFVYGIGRADSLRATISMVQMPADAPRVEIRTSMGSFEVDLYVKHAPRTCKNFQELARRGYYNGTIVSPAPPLESMHEP